MSTALLLAAGKATRLGALRERYAKACVPVAGTTPLAFLLEALARGGFTAVQVNTHYRAEQVRAAAEASAPAGLALHFHHEEDILGTGGTLLALAEAGHAVDAVVNAKMFTDFAFARLCDAAPGTLLLHPPSPLATFGGFRYDDRLRVRGLQGRDDAPPPGEQAAVFTGVCRPHPAWIDRLREARRRDPEGVLCLVRHGLLPHLEEAPGHATALLHPGTWCEISTPERVAAAEALARALQA
ncbi:MAG: nucleotidyltransferase family protein [Planctomycetota bacterium]